MGGGRQAGITADVSLGMIVGVELSPTPPEARRLVASITAFWLIAGLWPLGDDRDLGVLAFALVVAALAAGTVFYWTLYTVGARETGRRAREYMGWYRPRLRGPDSVFKIGQEGWGMLLKSLDPRWWSRVVRTTGWPVRITAAVLLGSLALSFSPLFRWG